MLLVTHVSEAYKIQPQADEAKQLHLEVAQLLQTHHCQFLKSHELYWRKQQPVALSTSC